jgi:hypothetical protein
MTYFSVGEIIVLGIFYVRPLALSLALLTLLWDFVGEIVEFLYRLATFHR